MKLPQEKKPKSGNFSTAHSPRKHKTHTWPAEMDCSNTNTILQTIKSGAYSKESRKKKKTWKSSATNRKNLGNRQVWVEILAWKWWTSTMWEPCASLEWSKLGTPILTHCCDSWRRYPPWPVLLLACTKLRVRKWARNGPSLLWLSH